MIQRTLFVVLAFVWGGGLLAHADDQRIRVHVFAATDPSGFTDQDGKDRAAAVRDAAYALSKSKLVVVVGKPEEADVTLEITRRVKELAQTSMGKSMLKNNSWSRSPESLQPFLYGTVTTGTFHTELRSTQPESAGQGRHLAKVFENWVRDNRVQIIAHRADR